jgi:hypothetical protein
VTLSPYENLSVLDTTNEDLGRLKSMWDFVGYKDYEKAR